MTTKNYKVQSETKSVELNVVTRNGHEDAIREQLLYNAAVAWKTSRQFLKISDITPTVNSTIIKPDGSIKFAKKVEARRLESEDEIVVVWHEDNRQYKVRVRKAHYNRAGELVRVDVLFLATGEEGWVSGDCVVPYARV